MRVAVRFQERTFDWYLERLEGIEQRGERDVLARCPAHDDGRPSLHVWEDDQGLGVYCFAGCSRMDVDEALEDMPPTPKPSMRIVQRRERGEVVARYVYTDESGEPLYRKLRFEPKDFVLQRGSRPPWWSGIFWSDGLKDKRGELLVRLVPYRLPEVVAAVERGAPVYVVDGEKDADRLAAEGVVATCGPYGMARWRPEFSEYLRGAEVVIVADRDEPGRRAASRLYAALRGIASSVRIVEAQVGKDSFDHLEAGLSVGKFIRTAPQGSEDRKLVATPLSEVAV